MLAAARANWGECFKLVRSSAEDVGLADSSADLLLFRYLLHHVAERSVVIAEAARMLRSGGLLLVETSDPDWLAGLPEYLAMPKVAAQECARWPGKALLVDELQDACLALLSLTEMHLVRDYVSVSEYTTRLERWVEFGGGTSSWSSLTPSERQQVAHLRMESLDANLAHVPVRSDSILICARKR
jgi:SAM-dependent methyltransferase